MKTAVERVQENFLKPLSLEESEHLAALLSKLVTGHEQKGS
jgi:hypothetical protein